MITEVLDWGLKPKTVTGDSWYSSRDNLKFLKNKDLGFLMGIAKNRKVSINGEKYTLVQNLEIPDDGLVVHLKKFGDVKVFRRTFKNEVDRYYIIYLPNKDATEQLTRAEFKEFHSIHWGIECASQSHQASLWNFAVYGESIAEGGFPAVGNWLSRWVRTSSAIRTHFFCAIRAFTQLELMRAEELIENWYQFQRDLSIQVARNFILEHLQQKVGINPTS